jgi:hypothetical protein
MAALQRLAAAALVWKLHPEGMPPDQPMQLLLRQSRTSGGRGWQ